MVGRSRTAAAGRRPSPAPPPSPGSAAPTRLHPRRARCTPAAAVSGSTWCRLPAALPAASGSASPRTGAHCGRRCTLPCRFCHPRLCPGSFSRRSGPRCRSPAAHTLPYPAPAAATVLPASGGIPSARPPSGPCTRQSRACAASLSLRSAPRAGSASAAWLSAPRTAGSPPPLPAAHSSARPARSPQSSPAGMHPRRSRSHKSRPCQSSPAPCAGICACWRFYCVPSGPGCSPFASCPAACAPDPSPHRCPRSCTLRTRTFSPGSSSSWLTSSFGQRPCPFLFPVLTVVEITGIQAPSSARPDAYKNKRYIIYFDKGSRLPPASGSTRQTLCPSRRQSPPA